MPIALRSPLPPMIQIDHLSVEVRVHPAARGLTLRYNARKSCFTLTKPKRFSTKDIAEFLDENRGWMNDQQRKIPACKLVEPGDRISLYGRTYTIRHKESAGVSIKTDGDFLVVQCRRERFSRALQRHVKKLATDIIVPMAHAKARMINKDISRVTLKDTTSRWGSCARGGKLSFSWRLIMAPPEVVDYIVGHEVAHLQHHHHKPSFWDLCRKLTPHTDTSKNWLDEHGLTLHQTQFTS
jgi:predicted metal-dependent hydrolase